MSADHEFSITTTTDDVVQVTIPAPADFTIEVNIEEAQGFQVEMTEIPVSFGVEVTEPAVFDIQVLERDHEHSAVSKTLTYDNDGLLVGVVSSKSMKVLAYSGGVLDTVEITNLATGRVTTKTLVTTGGVLTAVNIT